MQKFNRSIILEIIYLDNLNGEKVPSNDVNKRRTFKEQRITFHIENTFLGDYGLASFNIYNLTEDTKTFIQGGGRELLIRCSVGYGDEDPQKLFEGKVTNVMHLRRTTDIITTIYARDGMLIASRQVEPQSMPKNIDRFIALSQVEANNVDFNIRYLGNALEELQKDTYKFSTLIVDGTYSSVVKKILGSNFNVSFYQGMVNIRTKKQPDSLESIGSNETSSKIISVQSGLLEFPTVNYYNINFKHLLDPFFQPGEVFTIAPETVNIDFNSPFYERFESALAVNGKFRVMAVKHDGDTRDNTWSSDVEAFGVK